MKDTAVSPGMQTGVNLGDAQIAADRAHWATLRENGRVFQDTKGMYCVTSRAGVQYVLQHPELFSSAQAFAFEQTVPFCSSVPVVAVRVSVLAAVVSTVPLLVILSLFDVPAVNADERSR